MKRKFYYHPDNEKAVGDAVIEGKIIASSSDQLVSCVYMPKEDSDGPVLGWWIETWEPEDFMIHKDPPLFFIPHNGRMWFPDLSV